MSAVHALGAGSDAHQLWLRALVIAPGIPIVYLLALRILRYEAPRMRRPVPAPRPGAHPKPARRPAEPGAMITP